MGSAPMRRLLQEAWGNLCQQHESVENCQRENRGPRFHATIGGRIQKYIF